MPSNFISIDLKGVTKMLVRYEQGDLVAQQLLTKSMQQAVDLTGANAEIYAPESEANQPPTPYYIRGVGTQYANSNRGESKQLNTHWNKVVELHDNGVVGRVSNDAPYGHWVHGQTMQAWFHKLADRKWRTVGKIASDMRPKINAVFVEGAKIFARYLKTGKIL